MWKKAQLIKYFLGDSSFNARNPFRIPDMKFVPPFSFLLCLFLMLANTERLEGVNPLEVENWDPQDSMFQEYPFEKFAETVTLFDVGGLHESNLALENQGFDGAKFVLTYLEHYLRHTPPTLTQPKRIDSLFQLANRFLGAGAVLDDSDYLYETCADRLFSELSELLQQEINAGNYSAEDPKIAQWVGQLKDQQYLLHLEVSDLEKGLHHLEGGNLDYVLDRIWNDHKGKILLLLGCMILAPIGIYRIGFVRGKKKSTN